jgi:hypothetical protein
MRDESDIGQDGQHTLDLACFVEGKFIRRTEPRYYFFKRVNKEIP